MAQQTAVSWLQDKLKETYDKEGKLPLAYTLHLVQQAKQMEKEQIINAVNKTRNKLVIGEEFNAPWSDDEVLSNGERYYKYIYGNQGTDGNADKTK